MLPSGPRGPSLRSVLRGGITYFVGPPVRSLRGQALLGCFPSIPFGQSKAGSASQGPTAPETRRQAAVPVPTSSGLYGSSFFHIASTIAAIFRAMVSLARFGFVPFARSRS